MRKLLTAAVLGLCAVTAPLPAHADGPGYVGGCRLVSDNLMLPSPTPPGDEEWQIDVSLVAVATTPADTISASCWLKINGGAESKLLDGVGPGTGFAAGAVRTSYNASQYDAVFLCTHVTTGSAGFSDLCVQLTTTPVCPDQVCADGGLLDQAVATVNVVLAQTAVVDPVVCPVLVAAAPTVYQATLGQVYVDGTGDTYLGSPYRENLPWDCPPYIAP